MILLNIIDIDKNIFSLINSGFTSDFLDTILVFSRNEYFWIPLYIFIISYVVLNFKKKAYWFLFFLILTVSVTDIVSSSIIKPAIERPRPCHQEGGMAGVRLLVPCGSGYSFTSSHATNHFGIAFFLIFTLGRRFKFLFLPLFIWASIISYAQVYVGVHYPLDVLSGALLGTCIALLMSELYSFSMKSIFMKRVKI